jgi:hypothetical protein
MVPMCCFQAAEPGLIRVDGGFTGLQSAAMG